MTPAHATLRVGTVGAGVHGQQGGGRRALPAQWAPCRACRAPIARIHGCLWRLLRQRTGGDVRACLFTLLTCARPAMHPCRPQIPTLARTCARTRTFTRSHTHIPPQAHTHTQVRYYDDLHILDISALHWTHFARPDRDSAWPAPRSACGIAAMRVGDQDVDLVLLGGFSRPDGAGSRDVR